MFLTGYDDENIRERAKKLEPAYYMVKPVDVERIDARLKSIIS